jgi:hypothetical protein
MSVYLDQQLNVGNVSVQQRKLAPVSCNFPMGSGLLSDVDTEIAQVQAGYTDQGLTDQGKIDACQTAVQHFTARGQQARVQRGFWSEKARWCRWDCRFLCNCKNKSEACNKSQNTLDGDVSESYSLMVKYATALSNVSGYLSQLQAEFDQDINNQQQVAETNTLIAETQTNISQAEQSIVEAQRSELGLNIERYLLPITIIILAFVFIFKK